MRIALGLEYDGSAFCGWQSQAQACGVQDHLQSALSQLQVKVDGIAAPSADAKTFTVLNIDHIVITPGTATIANTGSQAFTATAYSDSGGLHSITGGLNYYIHGDGIKVMANYVHTWSDFREANPQFGQDKFDEVLLRLQVTF